MYVVDTNLVPVEKWCMILICLYFNRLKIFYSVFPDVFFILSFYKLQYVVPVIVHCVLHASMCALLNMLVCVCVNVVLVWLVIFEFFAYGSCCCECLVLNVILKCVMLSYIHILSLSEPMFSYVVQYKLINFFCRTWRSVIFFLVR
jgi:hypothetical protein